MYIYIYIYVCVCVCLVCICWFVLSYLPKLKKGMALAFRADFLYMFSIKMFLDQVPVSDLISLQRYQTK